MEWLDKGIVLSANKFGENSAIAILLTESHGRHSGLVRGAYKKSTLSILQPGNLVEVRWRARLLDHLGLFTVELITSHGTPILSAPTPLAALRSACALAETALADRQPNQPVFEGLNFLLESLNQEFWPKLYIKWELGLLSELGFGLDFSKCAATGAEDNLTHISPKSGKAVSSSAAAPYIDRLLPLPEFLLNTGNLPSSQEICQALELTGYFFRKHVFNQRRNGVPSARVRLAELLR